MNEKYILADNTYYEEESNSFTIDAWQTNDGEEEGKVVAIINATTCDVYFIDKSAQNCKAVKDAISQRIEIIKAKKMVKSALKTE